MSAMLLKGTPVAEALDARTTEKTAALAQMGITPTLAILRVGERKDQLSYEQGAMRRCAKVGVAVKNAVLPDKVDKDIFFAALDDLNRDEDVHGILMLRPLPAHLDEKAACHALAPEKDADGCTEGSLAGVFMGKELGFAPCTARACMEVLDHYGVECRGKRAVVLGRSLVVGRPAAMMLLMRDATVTICHSGTLELPEIVRQADIVLVATGKTQSIGWAYFCPGQTVLDVGIDWSERKQKLCGDVIMEEAEPIVGAITPVPGGIGAVTTAVLANQVVEAAQRQLG